MDCLKWHKYSEVIIIIIIIKLIWSGDMGLS